MAKPVFSTGHLFTNDLLSVSYLAPFQVYGEKRAGGSVDRPAAWGSFNGPDQTRKRFQPCLPFRVTYAGAIFERDLDFPGADLVREIDARNERIVDTGTFEIAGSQVQPSKICPSEITIWKVDILCIEHPQVQTPKIKPAKIGFRGRTPPLVEILHLFLAD